MSNNLLNDIKILYEDEDCLVIDKPALLMVHPDGRSQGPFVTDWILEHYPSARNVGEGMRDQDGEALERSGIVHRLDRETSGALIIAKNQDAHSFLKKQFQDRLVQKKYLAFVWGEIKDEFGTINRPIGRSGSDFRKYSAQRGARGDMKEAETYWTKLSDCHKNIDGTDYKFSLVEVEPKTGRTHQIRVHFNAINHPVVSDILYAPKKPKVLGFERIALHSRSIKFTNLNEEVVEVVAPLPLDFKRAISDLGIETLKLV